MIATIISFPTDPVVLGDLSTTKAFLLSHLTKYTVEEVSFQPEILQVFKDYIK